jgi:hypothetical protein
VLGCAPGAWTAERLTHNPRNAVTRGVWRVAASGGSAVLKLLTCEVSSADPKWASSRDLRHWNYWRREAEFYASELPAQLAEHGIASPRLLARFDRSPGAVALWLEDVAGKRGDEWLLGEHVVAARLLGEAQGCALAARAAAEFEWTSRRFLRGYADKPVEWSLLEDDEVWGLPLVASCLGSEVREAGRRLLAEREWLLGWMERLPRTLCHLDFWPMNLICRENDCVVALDWAFVGDGALGEDLGNHVPDAAFDSFVAPDELAQLDQATFDAYLAGLALAGWSGDEDLARMGVCASAVKYVWLLPLMLERARSGDHGVYGGVALEDPSDQYQRRGRTLRFLASWVDEAHRLAPRVDRIAPRA